MDLKYNCCCEDWRWHSGSLTHLSTIRYCPWCGRQLGWPKVKSEVTIGCATTYTTYVKEPKDEKKESEKERRDRESREKDREGWKR